MFKYLIFSLLIIFLPAGNTVLGQRPEIRNIDFNIQHSRLVIDYDLVSESAEPQNVLFFLWDDSYSVLVPRTIFGDVGDSVEPGAAKQITWDIVQDNHLLAGRLRPRLVLSDDFFNRGGSRSVLYSFLVPGLGGYFVADHRSMKFKPYMRTLSSVSFLSLGIYASGKRTRESLYSDRVNLRTGQTENLFYGYGSYNHWLFPNDNFVFLSLGAAIWIYDIIWVANRGGRNDKLRRAFDNINFSFTGSELGLKIQLQHSY